MKLTIQLELGDDAEYARKLVRCYEARHFIRAQGTEIYCTDCMAKDLMQRIAPEREATNAE